MTETKPDPITPQRAGTPIQKSLTRIRGLDDILFGGLPVGRINLISGGPGTGKTLLAMEFLYRCAEAGEKGLFVSFEERAEDLHANAAAMGFDTGRLEAEGRLRIVHAAIPRYMVSSGDFDIQGLLAILDGHIRSLSADCIAVDAIDVLMRVFGDPNREREELHALLDWFRNRGLTTVLTAKSDAEGAQRYPFLDYMADCVIYLDQRFVGQVRTRRLQVVKYRGSAFLPNEHPYVIGEGGFVFMPISSVSLADVALGEPVSSGDSQLDAILGGGYLRGASVLISGASGAGKTTFACAFIRQACQSGERAIYIGLEQSEEAILAEMKSVGTDLSPFLTSGHLRILTAMPESAGVEQHLARFLDGMADFRPHHLVVDAVSACRRMGSRQAAFEFLVRLLTACKEKGVTCICTNQIDGGGNATRVSGKDIASLMDGLIVLEYASEEKSIRRRLLVIKSRGAAHSMIYHPFTITDRGISLDAEAGPVADAKKGVPQS
jgi:circadian clock protein KaiC